MVNLPGYNFISNHRRGKTGGGVGLYLGDYFQYKLIQDCNISNPEVIESLFVEISNPLGKNIIVGTVYRPPNQNPSSFPVSHLRSPPAPERPWYGVVT